MEKISLLFIVEAGGLSAVVDSNGSERAARSFRNRVLSLDRFLSRDTAAAAAAAAASLHLTGFFRDDAHKVVPTK